MSIKIKTHIAGAWVEVAIINANRVTTPTHFVNADRKCGPDRQKRKSKLKNDWDR